MSERRRGGQNSNEPHGAGRGAFAKRRTGRCVHTRSARLAAVRRKPTQHRCGNASVTGHYREVATFGCGCAEKRATITVRRGEQFLRHLSAPAWPAETRMRRKEGAPKIVFFKCIATDRAPRHSLHQKSNTVSTYAACDARRLFAECSAEHPESCGPKHALHSPPTNWCAARRQRPSLRRMLSRH